MKAGGLSHLSEDGNIHEMTPIGGYIYLDIHQNVNGFGINHKDVFKRLKNYSNKETYSFDADLKNEKSVFKMFNNWKNGKEMGDLQEGVKNYIRREIDIFVLIIILLISYILLLGILDLFTLRNKVRTNTYLNLLIIKLKKEAILIIRKALVKTDT